jgi:signal peptidase II
MEYGEVIYMLGLQWAQFRFVENEGMAFGISLGENYGKLALSIFRIIAVFFLIYIVRGLIKSKESIGLIACFGLILAGAIGNILDSAFYGILFSDSYGTIAQFRPEEGGYASFLYGRVVDMFYFPIIRTTLPEWFPIFGGKNFEFFRPIFNVADSAITIGVTLILLFYRRIFVSAKTATEPKTE